MKDLISRDLILDINTEKRYSKISINDELNKYFANIPKCTYPKYNIIYINNNSIKLELALAGFEKNNLKVIFNDNQLTIIGNDINDSSIYLMKFVSSRNFAISFYLKPNVVINNVNFIQGLLIIELYLQQTNNHINYIPIGD